MELKSSRLVIRVTVALLAAALLGCGLLLARESLGEETHSVVAAAYTYRESVELTGLIVRQETVLSSHSLYTSVSAPNGLRAAAGETLGLAFSSQSDLTRSRRMRALEEHIALAEAVLSGAEENTAAERAEQARSAVLSLSADIARHDVSSLQGDVLRVRSLLFDNGAEVTREELSALRGELEEMKRQGEVAAVELVCPASGYFTTLLDGGENLDPAVLTNITVSSLHRLMECSGSVDGWAYGKLVSGSEWYLGALLGQEDAARLTVGATLELDLSRYRAGVYPVEVVSVSESVGGECAVLLRSDRGFAETLELRQVEAALVLRSVTGLRLPAAALQQSEGGYYVTVDTGSSGRRCGVELLYDGGEYVLVQGAGLSEGSAVEVRGRA